MEDFKSRLKKAVQEVYKLSGQDLENYYLLKSDYSKLTERERESLILLIYSK
jgi:hypothetical protein